MLNLCEAYGNVCGALNVHYPACAKLYEHDLPYVNTATHFGHKIHQDDRQTVNAARPLLHFYFSTSQIMY